MFTTFRPIFPIIYGKYKCYTEKKENKSTHNVMYQTYIMYIHSRGGGGGGTQMLFGRGCAADAAKPVPIFKGHFGGKGYPLLGVLRKRVPIIRGFYSRKLRFCVL